MAPTTLGDRLEQVAKMRGLSMRELSRRAGLSHGALAHHKGTERKLNHEALAKIAVELGINGHWLLTGQGDPDLLVVATVGPMVEVMRALSGRETEEAPDASKLNQGPAGERPTPARAKKLGSKA